MTDRKRPENAVVPALRDEELAAMTAASDAVAHEVNNQLTIAAGNIEIALASLADPRLTDALRKARDALTLASASSRTLIGFAATGARPASAKGLVPTSILEETINLLRRTKEGQFRIASSIHSGLWPVPLDALELETALLILAANAFDAMPEGGVLSIIAANALQVSGERQVVVTVRDTGEGMTPDILAAAGRPFFTTKSRHARAGLGLASVKALVESRGGRLEMVSAPGTGTAVTMRLPCVAPPVKAPQATGPDDVPLGDGETVLLFASADTPRDQLASLIEGLGYAVETRDRLEPPEHRSHTIHAAVLQIQAEHRHGEFTAANVPYIVLTDEEDQSVGRDPAAVRLPMTPSRATLAQALRELVVRRQ